MENKEKDIILSVKDLEISFKTDEGLVHAVRGVSFDLIKGETLCIVGESGSGKSVTSKTIMGILPASAVIENGSIIYEGEDLTKIEESEFHRIRGHKIGMIFQDPLSSLNPIMKVGKQITEAMLVNSDLLKRRYDKLISVDEANYKNCKVKRDTAIASAKHAVEASDYAFKDEINTLEAKLKELKFAVDSTAKDDPTYQRKVDALNAFKVEFAQKKSEILAQKKAKHAELSKQISVVKKEANATYKAELPELKAKLKEAKKKANADNENYKKEAALEHKKKLEEINAALANAKEEDKEGLQEQIKLENERYVGMFKLTKKAAKQAALKVMQEVGIPQPELRFKQYPFEFSGGMRQRIVIAIALTANPEILICDEPTTALDVTIQAQILELINRLKAERHMSIIFISHDLGVVANMADRVAVMYAGKIVEVGTANDIFYDPRHPYTWALLSSIPDIDSKEKLEAIPGTPPYLLNPPKGDAFAARNKYALAIDFKEEPPYFAISETHYAATWLLDERAPKVEKPKIVSQRIKASLKKAGIENE